MKKRNIGILASISWNSNNWQDQATDNDLDNSNYEWVKENGWMHEDLNFGYLKYPAEEDGTYIAYSPMFNTLPSLEESKYVDIVFFRSLNYHSKQNCIVGFYAYPQVDNFIREADHELFEQYDTGNVRSKVEHIVLFQNSIPISNEIAASSNYLPTGKKLGQQGYNYLHYENVIKIFDKATELNPADNNLKNIKFKFLTDTKYKFSF